MRAKVVFLARVNDGTGKYPFVPVQIKRDRPIPLERAAGYYVRYSGMRRDGTRRRVVQPLLSEKIEEAYVEFLNIEKIQKELRAGQIPTLTNMGPAASTEHTLLKDAIDEYLKECAVRNSADTVASDTRILYAFRDDCFSHGVSTIEFFKDAKAGRKRLLDHIAWLKTNLRSVSVDGKNPENTRNKRMNRISTFFRQHGIKVKKSKNAGPDDPGLLAHHEFPAYKAQNATMYSQEMIASWKAAATVDELDLIEFFLATGFRDSEVAFTEWSDVDWANKTVNVHAKAKTATRPWSWMPKDRESRPVDIPLSDAVISRLKSRRARYASARCNLIFPSNACKPDNHLLRRVRQAAKRAGIRERIALHTIRKTVGSNLAEKYGVTFAMDVLGHSDIKTTQGYMARNRKTVDRMREDLNSA
jgi:integrase